MLRSFKMTVAYDGTHFMGWQLQRHGRTVQGVLQEAVERVTCERSHVIGSGRTDAGVHAVGQVASFESHTYLEPAVIKRALNASMPVDVTVRDVQLAPHGFHAIRDAVGKRYRYIIHDSRAPDIFGRQYSWYIPVQLNLDAMREAASYLIGEHDFAGFQNVGNERRSSIRTVHEIILHRDLPHADTFLAERRMVFEIAGNGFLYNMVRNIVGTLVHVGRGRAEPGWVAEILAARDRTLAGMTAPAHGLFLMSVEYSE